MMPEVNRMGHLILQSRRFTNKLLPFISLDEKVATVLLQLLKFFHKQELPVYDKQLGYTAHMYEYSLSYGDIVFICLMKAM